VRKFDDAECGEKAESTQWPDREVGQAGYRLMHKQCAVYPRWGCNPNE